MITADQIIYFINHIADADHADRHERAQQIFCFLIIPVLIALFHIVKLAKIFRGNINNLIWITFSLFFWSIILPLVLVIHSLIYIHNANAIPYWIILYFFWVMLYVFGLEEYFPRYLYATDAEYEAAIIFSDGSLINTVYPNKFLLQALAIWIIITAILLIIQAISFFIALLNHWPYTFAMILACIGGSMLFAHLIWFRWLVKCPNCHRPIYNIPSKNGRNDVLYLVRVAWIVLTKKKCDCVTCHATYYVK